MMNVKNSWPLFGFVILVLIMSQACENDIEKVNEIIAGSEKNVPVESSTDVEFLYSDSAQIQMKLTAGKIDRFTGEKNYFETPDGLHVFFYDNYPVVKTQLKADYGVGKDSTNTIDRMEVKRNVVVINEKGDKLNTEHLIWDAKKKRIYTKEFVKITTKDEVIWGNGLDADEDFSHYEIKDVKGQINIKDSIQ
jgi:LPS export ABC transporter protein LptC